MQWIRIWPATPGYRLYLDAEKCTQLYVDVVSGSSPATWVIYASQPTVGATRLDLGSWSNQADANAALESLVESL